MEVPDEIELAAPQARVLGCLIEKRATTPETYPLTLKAVVTAWSQTSSRVPIVDYDAQLVETTALALKSKALVRVVHPAHGERATRYRHVIDEALGLDEAELAVFGVLLLRGAQTVAELRTRTERQHSFAGVGEVESVLGSLAARPTPMVQHLERQAGQKETRWIQMIEADPEGRAAAVPTGGGVAARPARVDADRVESLEVRVAALEAQVARLLDELGIDARSE